VSSASLESNFNHFPPDENVNANIFILLVEAICLMTETSIAIAGSGGGLSGK